MGVESRLQERINRAKEVLADSNSWFSPDPSYRGVHLLPLRLSGGIRPLHLFENVVFVPGYLSTGSSALAAGVMNNPTQPIPQLKREYRRFTCSLKKADFVWDTQFPFEFPAQFYPVHCDEDLRHALSSVQEAVSHVVDLYRH